MNSRQYVTLEYVKDIGWRLYKAVASYPTRISSGKECTDLIRSVRGRKRRAIKYLVPEIFKLSQWVSDVRDKRRSRMRYIKKHVPGEHGREILRAHIRRLLPHAFIETRFSGEYRLQVFVGTPDAKGESSYGEAYPGRHKWAKTNVTHRITVMPGWIRLPDSLKVVEGRLVLSAEIVADGIYRVTTAIQSRGCALRVEHGWVATCATVDPAFGKTMCAADRKRSLRLQQFMGRALERHNRAAHGYAGRRTHDDNGTRKGNRRVRSGGNRHRVVCDDGVLQLRDEGKGRWKMIPASRILRSDAYLVWLVFCRYAATGFGLGMGLWFAALLLGVFKRIGG